MRWILLYVLCFGLIASFCTAITPLFCTDLNNYPLNVAEIDKIHPTMGTESNSLQTLWSKQYKDLFDSLSKETCVDDDSCDPAQKCKETVRNSYFALALKHMKSVNGLELNNVNGTAFTTYIDRVSTQVTPEIQLLYDLGCILYCAATLESKKMERFNCYCPNPCKYQTSCPESSCTVQGIFDHQYECKCAEGETWDPQLHTCLSKTWVALREKKAEDNLNDIIGCSEESQCDKTGTMNCVLDEMGQNERCICKPHYMGQNCTDAVDACQKKIQHPFLPGGGMHVAGEVACNVNSHGNLCMSFLSSEADVSYRCNCDEQHWIPDHTLVYDNCLRRRSMCDSVVCVNGRCVTNEHGLQPHCICSPGYHGASCTEWVGEWSEWSPWDKCTPACGDVRYSVRSRDCLSTLKDPKQRTSCHGAPIEYARCAEHPCARTEGIFINTYFAIRQSAIASSIAAAAIACAVVSGIWAIFCWRIISRIIYSITTKMHQKLDERAELRKTHSARTEEATINIAN